MQIKKLKLNQSCFPEALRYIPSPPKQLYCRGAALSELMERPRVAIVGSRGPSTYGQQVTTRLARELAEQGIVIISGLALGVDALAHQAALEVDGLCLAVLPGPVDQIYPRGNQRLAEEILAKGGALTSEYGSGEISFKQNFIARNRLVSGLAQAVLITEATVKSGSRHTVDFAADQGRTLLAVPGNITSNLSEGPNRHLKTGAIPVTECQDVLEALGLQNHATPARQVRGDNPAEQTILDLLLTGITEGDKLLTRSHLATTEFNQALTMLEITGKIRPLGANHWSIR
jgi:DNA processing protein